LLIYPVATKKTTQYFKPLVFLLLSGVSNLIAAQQLEVDQINQFFRPRIKFDTRYYFPASFTDTTGNFGLSDVQISFTAPIKSKLDLDLYHLKDAEINQTLLTARAGYKQLNTSFDNTSPHALLNGSIGLMGIRMNTKLRINFYSFNIGFAEENTTMNKVQPRANLILGQMKIKSLRKNFHYGFLLAYSDRLILPIPFFGAELPLGKSFAFYFTLPAQIGLNYKPGKKLSANLFFTFDGFRSGYKYNSERENVNFAGFQSAANIRYKIGKLLFVKLESGYDIRNRIRITTGIKTKETFAFNNTAYILLSLHMNFGRSVFEKIF
jgi:Domain of unknown function (DUF6268)